MTSLHTLRFLAEGERSSLGRVMVVLLGSLAMLVQAEGGLLLLLLGNLELGLGRGEAGTEFSMVVAGVFLTR